MIDLLESVFEAFYLFLVLAVLGDIVVERSGVLNLGIDGFIVFSIALSYTATVLYGPLPALAIVIVCGILYAALISLFVNVLHLSHVLTGLVLNMAFYGLSVVIGELGAESALELLSRRTLKPPLLLRWYHVLAIAVAVAVAVWLFLYKTRLGTAIRACGFNPRAAEHLGVKIWSTRSAALIAGYAIISSAGYVYTLFYKASWTTYTGIGYGFLALALAMASLWHPLIAIAPVALFSYLERNQYVFQLSYGIPTHLLSMIPYLASIAFITAINASPLEKKLPIPRALGEVYFKEERAA